MSETIKERFYNNVMCCDKLREPLMLKELEHLLQDLIELSDTKERMWWEITDRNIFLDLWEMKGNNAYNYILDTLLNSLRD